MQLIALRASNLEEKLFCIIKRILVVNISNARNVFIRIPLKILIIIMSLILKLIFGRIYAATTPSSRRTAKPSQHSSPSSISLVLNSSDQTIPAHRKSTSTKTGLSYRQSTYSVYKTKSQSSLVNYFTPNYSINESLHEFSDIKSSRSTEPLEQVANNNLNDTELDCDSLQSSFYFDLKTQFSDRNADLNSDLTSFSQNDHLNEKNKMNVSHDSTHNASGLPDLINQKVNKDAPTDKARKYLEVLDGVKFNEIQVPDSLKKQLEYFDRDELLQLIAYQKKYLDFKETRIKDLENYIDNLVVKIIETEPLILMNASNVLTKSRNVI